MEESRWFVVRSNGALCPAGTIMVMELFSHFTSGTQRGKLKHFRVDGNGQLWLPAINVQKSKTPPQPLGELLLVSAELPNPEQMATVCPSLAGTEVLIIPGSG